MKIIDYMKLRIKELKKTILCIILIILFGLIVIYNTQYPKIATRKSLDNYIELNYPEAKVVEENYEFNANGFIGGNYVRSSKLAIDDYTFTVESSCSSIFITSLSSEITKDTFGSNIENEEIINTIENKLSDYIKYEMDDNLNLKYEMDKDVVSVAILDDYDFISKNRNTKNKVETIWINLRNIENNTINESPMTIEEKKLLVKYIKEYLNKMGYYAHNIELHLQYNLNVEYNIDKYIEVEEKCSISDDEYVSYLKEKDKNIKNNKLESKRNNKDINSIINNIDLKGCDLLNIKQESGILSVQLSRDISMSDKAQKEFEEYIFRKIHKKIDEQDMFYIDYISLNLKYLSDLENIHHEIKFRSRCE